MSTVRIRNGVAAILCAALMIVAATAPMSGCENLPGSRTEQSTVIGGASGAVLGAVIAKENRLIGALIGGALGAAGGYLIGAKTDWFEDDDDDEGELAAAREAAEEAQRNPATAAQARRADDADINNDGFVTLDEVIAMERAGFDDEEMIDRLEATDQVFDLNDEQREFLINEGVSRNVINGMLAINQEERDRILTSRTDVISSDPDDID